MRRLTGTIYTAPTNAVVIPAGANIQLVINAHPAGTAYLLTAGTYTGQTIQPHSGDSFYGQNGQTILNGNGAQFAFKGQGVSNVTVASLVITNYAPPSQGIGVLGTDASSSNWVVEGNEIENISAGTALMLGRGMLVRDNFIHNNQMGGIGAWDVSDAVVENNEISQNNLSLQLPFTATGNNAGIKIAGSTNTQVLNNYIHDNPSAPGIWTDLGNTGTVINGNTIINNGGPGIIDEIDYGSIISNNTIQGNNNPSLGGFLGGGIYIQNSQNANVYRNTLSSNVGGIWVYQSDRGAGLHGPYVVANDSIHNNTVQLSAGQNGYGGTATGNSISWYANRYYMSGSASLIAGSVVSVSQWQADGYDTAANGSTFSSGSLPTPTPTATAGSDGTTILSPSDAPIVDAQGNKWSLVASVNSAWQMAENGNVDPVTKDADLLQIDGGKIIQENVLDQFFSENATSPGSGQQIAQPSSVVSSDRLSLNLSEDAYLGNARFTVSVNKQQVGGPHMVTALHSAGDSEDFMFASNWGVGAQNVQISFINDAYGGSPRLDCNVGVKSITYDRYTSPGAILLTTRTNTFSVGASSTAAPPADTLVLQVSEDAYKNSGEFVLTIDKKVVTSPMAVTTLHDSGQWQDFTFSGISGAGQRTVSGKFVNDLYGGSPSANRSLYANSIDVNGTYYGTGTSGLYTTGSTATCTINLAH